MIFVDTGAFLARYVARDQHHQDAIAGWQRLAGSRERAITSSFVLDETFTLLGRMTTFAFSAERARQLLTSHALGILRPGANEELAAVELFEKYGDQEASFTDCVSFVLMQRNRIQRVFTFDRHFTLAGFEAWG